MIALINRILSVKAYPNRAAQDLARLAYGVVLLIMFLYSIFVLSGLLPDSPPLIARFGLGFLATYSLPLILILGVIEIVSIRRGRYDIARWGIPFLLLMVSLPTVYLTGPQDGVTLVLFILMGAVFIRERGVWLTLGIALVLLVIIYLYQQTLELPAGIDLQFSDMFTLALQLIGVGVLMLLFLRNTRLEELQIASTVTEDRLRLAQLITQLASSILRRTNLEQTLSGAVDEIRDRYPRAYHVQIFLVDEARRNARLAASTGAVGQMLLGRGHSLPVGSTSVIGRVTSSGEVVVARAGSTESVHKRNEFLPDTVVEAAFPLRSGDLVIGALDMQSKIPEAFPPEEIPIFQALADNIAIAIDNARLLQQAQDRVRENQRLAEQANLALQEVERLNRQLTAQTWQDYVERQGDEGITLDFDADQVQRRADATPTLSEAMRFNHIVQRQQPDSLIIAAPVSVRGTAIGALEFELDGTEPLEADQIELISAVCERLGLAVESARLFEESARTARREATLNDITRRLQSTNSINTILTEAARGIQESLGINRVAIRIGVPPGKPNGGAKE